MNKEDPRVIRTKKMFKEALEELLLKKDYETIQVKELCDKAGLNRRTFYLHYDSIDDILYDIQEEFAQEFYENTKDIDHMREPKRVIKEFFEITVRKGILYEKILTNSNFDYIREQMRNKVSDKASNNFKSIQVYDIMIRNIIAEYMHMSTVAIYREWVKQGKRIPIDEVIDIATKLVQNGLKSYVK